MNWEARARERVGKTPSLNLVAEIILDDWAEGDEHWEWVATAPEMEIVEWAEVILNGAEGEEWAQGLDEERLNVWLDEYDQSLPLGG